MQHQAARLWILEDDEQLCTLLKEQCLTMGWELETFHTPRTLERALADQCPDLLLLDQLLPDKLGSEVLARLRQGGHRFPVLMLSALGAPSDRIHGLEAGADDYLGKPFLFRELQLRVERLLRNRPPVDQPQLPQDRGYQIGALLFSPHLLQLWDRTGEAHRLSRGDGALLQTFCRHPDQVLSRTQLGKASGSLVDPSQSRSIDMRVSRLRRLLSELQNGEEAIESVRGQGYRLVAPVSIVALDG
ncbi:MAG: response regulator transcription factor [Cyanobacteriota bacterium]|nr:response regulator transcription factor [Cyanobacteriota bacterium]